MVVLLPGVVVPPVAVLDVVELVLDPPCCEAGAEGELHDASRSAAPSAAAPITVTPRRKNGRGAFPPPG